MSRSVTVSKKLLAQTRELIANGLVTGVATREMMPAQTAITLTEIQYSSLPSGATLPTDLASSLTCCCRKRKITGLTESVSSTLVFSWP
jgi:hypothetical protein